MAQHSAAVLAEDNYSHKEAHWRAPSVEDGEEVIFDEPGRVLGRDERGHNGVDYRSHYFRVTRLKFGGYLLRVKHGGGEESWSLGYQLKSIYPLVALDSDARYLILWTIMDAHRDSAMAAAAATAERYCEAFRSGRLKKRGPKVWIVPATT